MFTLCPVCWRQYSPEYIADADTNTCLNENCLGILFTIRRLASGGQQPASNLTYPYASVIAWIGHILGLAGMSELTQTWRSNKNDKDELVAPVTCNTWMQNLDPNKPIGDIHKGWGWRSKEAGMEQYREPETGDMVDRSPLKPLI